MWPIFIRFLAVSFKSIFLAEAAQYESSYRRTVHHATGPSVYLERSSEDSLATFRRHLKHLLVLLARARSRLLQLTRGINYLLAYLLSGRESGEEAESALINETWFVAVLIVVIGAVVWSLLCLFSVWIYRRHKAGKKIPKNRARPGQSVNSIWPYLSSDLVRSEREYC